MSSGLEELLCFSCVREFSALLLYLFFWRNTHWPPAKEDALVPRYLLRNREVQALLFSTPGTTGNSAGPGESAGTMDVLVPGGGEIPCQDPPDEFPFSSF